jgi:hypothetical protein
LERLVFAEKAGKIEIRGDRKFSNGTLEKFQIYTDLKTANWRDAKNAIERIENS